MRKYPNVILVILAILALTQPLTSQEAESKKDGNYLLKNCIQAVRSLDGDKLDLEQAMRSAFCLGYVNGFLGSHMLTVSLAESQPLFCTPTSDLKRSGVQVGQAVRIIVKWLKNHPEKLHVDGDILTLLALAEVFPCKSKKE